MTLPPLPRGQIRVARGCGYRALSPKAKRVAEEAAKRGRESARRIKERRKG